MAFQDITVESPKADVEAGSFSGCPPEVFLVLKADVSGIRQYGGRYNMPVGESLSDDWRVGEAREVSITDGVGD